MGTTPEDYEKYTLSSMLGTNTIGDDYPMFNVPPFAIEEFCARLSELTGLDYSIPTSEEWLCVESLGRKNGPKGDNTNYLNGQAWIGRSSIPVGKKTANELGVYDMRGNIAEYCKDGMACGADPLNLNHIAYHPTYNAVPGPFMGFRIIMRPKN